MSDVGPSAQHSETVSKSQRKRDSAGLQALAGELASLSPEQQQSLPLSTELLDQLAVVRSINKAAAKNRQIKFVGGMLRKIDPEPICKSLNLLKSQGAQARAFHHRLERWRDRLLAEGNSALTEILNELPGLDTQRIRQLIRDATRQDSMGKPPTANRLLYKYLREQFSRNYSDCP